MKVNMQVPHQDGSTFEGTFVLIIRVHVRHVHVGFIQNKVGLLYSYPPPKSSTVHTCSSHVRVCCSRVPYTYPRMWTFFCKNKVFRTFVKVTYCRGIHKYDTKVYIYIYIYIYILSYILYRIKLHVALQCRKYLSLFI